MRPGRPTAISPSLFAPTYPIKRRVSTKRNQTPDSVDIAHYGAAASTPLENSIRRELTFGSFETSDRLNMDQEKEASLSLVCLFRRSKRERRLDR